MRKRTKFHLAKVNDDGSYQYRTNEPFIIKGEFYIGIDKDGTLHIVQTEYDDSVKYIPVEKKLIDLQQMLLETQIKLNGTIDAMYGVDADKIREVLYDPERDPDWED